MYWSGLGAANAAAAYQTGQTGYQVGHTPAAASAYTAQRAAGSTYDTTYQTAAAAAAAATHTTGAATYPTAAAAASTTYDYGYGRPAQTAATAVAYDTSKSYYAAQPAAATVSYTAPETHYQNKVAYTSASPYTATTRQTTPAVTPKTTYSASAYSNAVAAATTYNTTAYAAQTTVANKAPTATLYLPQTAVQQATTAKVATPSWQANFTAKKTTTGTKPIKPKAPPKPQQLHYCDVCKISCAGPQTYREHLEGQKHKKKEAIVKAGPAPARRVGAKLRCELCDVTCTASDAYAAHIRGAKHQKVVKLHQKLGKPIPSNDPVVIVGSSSSSSSTTTKSATTTSSTGNISSSMKASPAASLGLGIGASSAAISAAMDAKKDEAKDELAELKEKEVEPVGQEYIEEIKNEEDKVISFNCKLCECRFNDPNAKEMHMKGRRHRLQYKKKVNPELVVEVKPSLRQRKIQEEKKLRRQQLREEMWRRREEERMMEEEERWFWEERRRFEEECDYYEWGHRHSTRGGPRGPHPPGSARGPYVPGIGVVQRYDSRDDRHIIAKHAEIYPKEDELNAVQKIVSNTEKALKLVSDYLSDVDAPKAKDNKKKPKHKEIKIELDKKDTEKKEEPPRMLKGVMRVGILAKGLLLKGDNRVQLVVLCGDKPTRTLLDRVADNLPKQLAVIASDEKYEIHRVVEEASLVVQNRNPEQRVCVIITLTSPVIRETVPSDGDCQVAVTKDPPDVLDKQKSLDALAALRHAKWFQARANGLQSCVMVIRILRDLCQRLPTWAPLNKWAMELLCEKVIGSAGQPLSPGDAFRRVFEALASGILLPGTPGLMDPCEKDPTDAAAPLSAQEREDITASAQHALRLIAFRQVHKVLGIDPVPLPKFNRSRLFNRKRRRDNSVGDGNNSESELTVTEKKIKKKKTTE